MPKPIETYLISDHVPFRLDGLDGTVEPVYPILEFYEISQPDPEFQDLRMSFPTEIAHQILDALVLAYLRNKEFALAAGVCRVSRGYLRRMYVRWLVDRPFCPAEQLRGSKPHTTCYASKIFAFFYLGALLFNHAFDISEEALLDLYESDDEEERRTSFRRSNDVPVVTIDHPMGLPRYEMIKPHQLVGRYLEEWVVKFDVTPFPTIKFTNFDYWPTIAWVGNRFCDCFALDAKVRNGVYEASRVLFPFLIIRLDTEEYVGSGEWRAAVEHWRRFADLVYVAFEGAQLYIADGYGACEKV